MSLRFNLFIIILALIFTLSCGGGGSGDVGNNDDNGGGTQNGGTLNSNIEGKFLFDYYGGDAYTMDVKTGEYKKIPNTHWASQTDRFGFDAASKTFFLTPKEHDSSKFIVVASGASVSYVALQDDNGNYLGQLQYSGRVSSAVISQDGQYIALFRKMIGGDRWLEIYNWEGILISDRAQQQKEVIWLRDNRLLYADGRTVYFTEPASTDIEYTLTLPEPGNGLQAGNINNISISPDEMQLAFTIIGDVSGTLLSRLYMVNIDGSDLRLVATDHNDETPKVSLPNWSPDGRWLYVEEGYTTSQNHFLGTRYDADMYIVPTENLGKVFYLSEHDSERSPEVQMFKRYNTLGNEPGGITAKITPGAYFYWLPN